MIIDLNELKKFLGQANLAGYANQVEAGEGKEPDGSTTINYQEGPWVFQDNYFGGEPFGGREVVFYNGKSVFIMVYYGRISDKTADQKVIYDFLRQALKLFPPDKPFRGPEKFEAEIGGDKMEYVNKWQGDLDYFFGKEKIFINGKEVYEARYAGGLVGQ